MNVSECLDLSLEKISKQLDIEFNYTIANHNFELGMPRESALRAFFKRYFPKRYGFSAGYLIDYEGQQSNQCDWIIYDQIYFQPLMPKAQIEDNIEFIHFDSAFGGVEVKSKLDETVMGKAIDQVSSLKKLKRSNYETAACFTPLINAQPLVGKDLSKLKTANFYSGIYAYSSDILSGEEVIKHIFEYADNNKIAYEYLPDFVAVHGEFFVCKSERNILPDNSLRDRLTHLPQQENSYAIINSGGKTAGIFYFRMLGRFNNTFLTISSLSESMTQKVLEFELTSTQIFKGKIPLSVNK